MKSHSIARPLVRLDYLPDLLLPHPARLARYECMLQSVLVARDRFLAPWGTVLPNKTVVVLEVADEAAGTGPLDFWDRVYGFDLSPVKKRVRVHTRTPLVRVLPAGRVASSRCVVHTFDCVRMGVDDVDVPWTPFSVTLARDTAPGGAAFVVLSFDTHFDADGGCKEKAVEFRTDAASRPTHWMQTLLRLPMGEPELMNAHRGERECGELDKGAQNKDKGAERGEGTGAGGDHGGGAAAAAAPRANAESSVADECALLYAGSSRLLLPAGTVVAGEVQIKRNGANPRELDISLRFRGFPHISDNTILYYHMDSGGD